MQEWSEKQLDDQLKEGQRAFIFFHTPFCGTCQLAKKMLTVAEAMLPGCNHRNEQFKLYAFKSRIIFN